MYTGLTESFKYDNLDRLDSVNVGNSRTLNMGYDNKGSITLKDDVGTLLYNDALHPYRVSNINPGTPLTPPSDQTLTYTSFGSISSISENNYSASFVYNADNQRAKMIVQQNSGTILTRWYPTGSYIKETAGSVTKEYTFIGGDSYTAPIVAITQSGTTTYYNILRDYLGNITHIVNATTGAVTAEYSFDAWGRMRNPATWTNYAPDSEPALFLAGRGFTGHEHLPWFNLINMNGRVYDALLGMFLSADNYVQNPDLTQNYNRYGYCLNNPLKYTDPSGMLMAGPEYNSSIDDINAYFGHMCDVTGAWHMLGGGGGGYHYDKWSGTYRDGNGEYVSWSEVYYNYVVPNSYYSGEAKSAFISKGELCILTSDGSLITASPSKVKNGPTASKDAGGDGEIADESNDVLIYDGKYLSPNGNIMEETSGTVYLINSDNETSIYKAVSGSNNCNNHFKTISTGDYTVYGYTPQSENMFSRYGIGFFAHIWGSERTGLGFHPCRSYGTQGCIGLVGPETEISDFQCNLIRNQNKIVKLYVFIKH